MRVIIGAGQVRQEGWIATDCDTLDILSDNSVSQFFGQNKASAMLAEHVWEHFTNDEAIVAARHCFNNLEEGGYLRVAVPDGNLRNATFLKMVGIGGPGPSDHPAASHKVLYTYSELVAVFETVGFEVTLLEYCDDNGDFHYRYWNPSDGKIGRSLRYDTRNSIHQIGMASIIIDAHKPLTVKSVSDL